MKRLVAAVFFVLLPAQGFAKEQLRKFRWQGGHPSRNSLLTALPKAIANPLPHRNLLKGVGEFVAREGQVVGKASIAGAWKQTILNEQGQVTYMAGEMSDAAPAQLAIDFTNGLESAMLQRPELRDASRIFPPTLELKKIGNDWKPYWKVEYLSAAQDRLRYLHLSEGGALLEQGELDWDGVDGRAMVFPRGPKKDGVREVALHDLTGDGTVTGRLLHVISALNLRVWSPELTFFFPESDQRFDLGQAYFTIDQGYRWLKDHLGIELHHPIEVKLHVGNNGVSNAAFYHQNTIYLGAGDGQTYKDMIHDPSILIHESIHAVIDAYVGLPSQGEGGGFNEGFADLFTALILDNPRMGEASYLPGPYRRTLETNLKAYRDFAPGVYQNGTIVAATFWDMKPSLGAELTAKLAFRTLVRLGKGAAFDDFPGALRHAAEGLLTREQLEVVVVTARERGWRME